MKKSAPIRLLTAVPICDGHDSAINTINLQLIRHGIEVVYLGYNRPARDIVRAAVQEDVRAIGLSSYNGGHVEFFTEILHLLARRGARDIGLFGGGGGTITPADARLLHKRGVDRIFFAGTPLDEMVNWIQKTYRRHAPHARQLPRDLDRRIARLLSNSRSLAKRPAAQKPLTIGVTGPGGAGKTTLIDELVLRILTANPDARIAILSHDPSIVGSGALLGDRTAMIHCQSDQVFMRSLATAGRSGGLAPSTESCLHILQNLPAKIAPPFDVIFVETVGVGQESAPFARHLVDQSILVLSPDYGSRLQLQKIVMLDLANLIVVNKSDLPAAPAASAEIHQRLSQNRDDQKVVGAIAKRHRDPGVDKLFQLLGAA